VRKEFEETRRIIAAVFKDPTCSVMVDL